MKPTGSLHPTLDKSKVIAILENLPVTSPESVIEEPHNPTDRPTCNQSGPMCLIVDGMAVVQELMAVKQFKSCKALGDAFVSLIDAKARCYQIVRVVFDNYSVHGSLKETTRERRRGGKKEPVRKHGLFEKNPGKKRVY